MTIVLREVTCEAAEAILAGERPADVRVADDYPTEFSTGMAQNRGYATAAVEALVAKDDTDEAGNVLRVKEWELTVSPKSTDGR